MGDSDPRPSPPTCPGGLAGGQPITETHTGERTMAQVTASIKDGVLTISIPCNVTNPPRSASGKSLVVASTNGNQALGVQAVQNAAA